MLRARRSKPAKSQIYERSTIAVLAAGLTIICVGYSFLLAGGTQFLMPGPLASDHVAIENCSACHRNAGDGKLSWINGLVATDHLSDSKSCLTCHKMPDTAFNPHGASEPDLKQRTERLQKVAAQTPAPNSANLQSIAFPVDDMVAGGVNCASCHQEHQGADFDLNKVSDKQCRTCHVVKFDSFDGHHPTFENYPFKRRTRIIYDHAAHFGEHYPEVAKKYPDRRIPETCSTCHDSGKNRRVMSVAPFDKTCTNCHLDQITGKERASGPKGIAFLSLPGLDVETLRQKKAAIGEWPEDSEAEITPFMKVVLAKEKQGRALIKNLDGLDLQDLSGASDKQIKAVTDLVWEIKELFYKLVKGKASDVLADISVGGTGKLSPKLITELTASMPRDVIVGAHQQWLPNLGTEMAARLGQGSGQQAGQPDATAKTSADELPSAEGSSPPDEQSDDSGLDAAATDAPPDAAETADETPDPDPDSDAEDPQVAQEDTPSQATPTIENNPQTCVFSLFGECLVTQEGPTQPGGTDAQGQASSAGNVDPNFLGGKGTPPTGNLQPAMRLGAPDAGNRRQRKGATQIATATGQSGGRSANKNDDLLFPTDEEIRALGDRAKEIGRSGRSGGGGADAAPANAGREAPASVDAPSTTDTNTAEPGTSSSPVAKIESDVDAETWAEYGGWYQQDHTVFYRPKGHKDRFIYSWLVLTGPQALQGGTNPAAVVFGYLTNKDAQGSCTKCHSVDTVEGKGRTVNFSPPSVETKRGRFTSFVHQPHFSIMDNRGCLTCHDLEKGRPYIESYKQGNPLTFTSNFGKVKKELCQSCHTSNKARQDCLLCHSYHVNGVITPTIDTKLPSQ